MAEPPDSSTPSEEPPHPFPPDFYPPSASSDEHRLAHLDLHLDECNAERIRLILRIAEKRSSEDSPSDPPAALPPASSGSPAPAHRDRKTSTLIAQEMVAQLFMTAAKKKSADGTTSPASLSTTAVLRPVFETVRFDPHDTFGKALFGPLFRESISLYLVLMVLWMTGIVLAWLAMWHFIPSSYVWFGLLTFPHIVYDFLIFNRFLFSLVLRQQHTMVFMLWCGVLLVAMLLEFKTQGNYIGFVFALVGSVVSCSFLPLFDTFPLHVRAITSKIGAPACVPFLIVVQAGLYFNWSESPPYVLHALGHLSYSASSVASSALNNIIILTAIYSWYGFQYPSSLVMIRSRTESFRLSEDEARVLRAMDAVARQTAAENKEEDFLTALARQTSRGVFEGKFKERGSKASGSKASGSKVAAERGS